MSDVNRAAELSAYFTHAKLQPMHQVCVSHASLHGHFACLTCAPCCRNRCCSACADSLHLAVGHQGRGMTLLFHRLQALSLRNAMSMFYKIKNFKTCATFCRRLLELNPGAQVWKQSGAAGLA